MPRIPLTSARLFGTRWVAALVLVCSVSAINLRAQAQPAPAPGPESFARTPKTPLELWDAIDYLVRMGQADQAVPYLKSFLQSKPDDAVLLEIRDRYGPGSIMRLGDFPATRPYVKPLMDTLVAAAHRNATNPERINRYIQGLTKTREEQAYSVEELRRAGPYAVPYLVQTLSRPALSAEDKALIVGNMGLLDRTAVPALLSLLDSPDGSLAAAAAEALGQIGDPRAIPYLTILAASDDPLSPARDAARRSIERMTGRPFEAQSRKPVRVLVDEARKYLTHSVNFPSDPVEIWVWDGAPTPRQVSRSEAEGILGLRFAREALRIEPANVDAQAVYLSLALEKAAERTGLANFLANDDPAGTFASALAAGPMALGEVLRTALAIGHSELAAVAATALGRVIDRDALPPDRRALPLIEALTSPDRHVQFAAAQALVWLEPRKSFPGSSRVVPVLARFITSEAVPKAVVIDSNASRGSQVVSYLKELGYDPDLAPSGDEGFRLAAGSADVELIVIEPSLFQGPWRLIDTLSNLRADANTAGIPIFIVAPLGLHEQLRLHTLNFPRVALLVTPANAQTLKRQLDTQLAQMGARPLSAEEKEQYARQAASLLAQVAHQPGSPFEIDLPRAGAALEMALNSQSTNLAASAALGDLPGIDAQRSLADVVLDPGKPAPLRLSAAFRLCQSIQRFGPLISAEQEKTLAEALGQTADPGLRNALSAVVGALRPKPDAVGRRLQASSAAAPGAAAEVPPPPAPEPAQPAEEAVPAAPPGALTVPPAGEGAPPGGGAAPK
jgi:HEAT repeat protein